MKDGKEREGGWLGWVLGEFLFFIPFFRAISYFVLYSQNMTVCVYGWEGMPHACGLGDVQRERRGQIWWLAPPEYTERKYI